MSKNGHAIFCLLFKMEQCAFLYAVCNDELILAKNMFFSFMWFLFRFWGQDSAFFVKLNDSYMITRGMHKMS